MNRLQTLLVFALAATFCIPSAFAYKQGTKAVAFGLNGVDSDLSISGQFGYYIIDYLEVGAQGGIDNGDETLWQVGPYAEYYIAALKNMSGLPLLPYVGTSGTYYNFDGESFTGYSGYAGLRYHVNSSFAIYGAYEQRFADEDIFVDDGELTDSDGHFRYGVRFFF